MCRVQRMTQIAHRVTLRDSNPRWTFKLGAVVTKGSRVIATGACATKTTPRNPKVKHPTPRTQTCAEVSACLHALQHTTTESLEGCCVYVVRATRSNTTYRIAKPCHHCQKFMKDLGIRHVYYSNQEGAVEKMDLLYL